MNFAEQILTHVLWRTYGFQVRQVAGGNAPRVWDGNVLKLGCDDGCTNKYNKVHWIKKIIQNIFLIDFDCEK